MPDDQDAGAPQDASAPQAAGAAPADSSSSGAGSGTFTNKDGGAPLPAAVASGSTDDGTPDDGDDSDDGAPTDAARGDDTNAVADPTCDETVPPAPSDVIGSCDYYTWRFNNFGERHVGCEHQPPDYYLNYGLKYCKRFLVDTAPELSPEGQEWLDKARNLLQVYMERELMANPDIELDNDGFRSMAFGTHPDAYWDAGFNNLSIKDLYIVATTPDLNEWAHSSTWSQAMDVGFRLFMEFCNQAFY